MHDLVRTARGIRTVRSDDRLEAMTKGENIAILGAAFQGVNEGTDHHIFRIDNQKTKLVKTRRVVVLGLKMIH